MDTNAVEEATRRAAARRSAADGRRRRAPNARTACFEASESRNCRVRICAAPTGSPLVLM